MIDTVQLRHQSQMPPAAELNSLGFYSACEHSESRKYIANPPKGSHLPRLTWTRREDADWLTAEVSLPKLYAGDNVRSLDQRQIDEALGSFQEFVEQKAQAPFNPYTALVGRVDYCHNFQLGSEVEVKNYLRAFQHITHARYSRRVENDSTVTFFNKSRETCVYSKFDECLAKEVSPPLVKASNGVLRFENRFIKSQSCSRHAEKLGVERLGAELLRADIAKKTLSQELRRLGMDKTIVTASARAEKLIAKFGTKATNYLGFLSMYEQFGKNFYTSGGISKATYFRMLGELRKAGLLIISDRELPALTLAQK